MAAWLLKMVNCLPKVRQRHRERKRWKKGENGEADIDKSYMGDLAQEHHLNQVGFSEQ